MPKLIRLTTSPIAFKYLLKSQMRYMHNKGMDVIMISSDGEEVHEIIINEQCRFIPVQMNRAITPLQDLKSIIKLIKIFKKEKPDIVHTHTPKAGLLGMIAAKLSRVPVRLHSNSGTPLITAQGLKRLIYFLTEYITSFCAVYVLPNSPSLLNYLQASRVCNKNKLFLLGKGSTNGIDIDYFNKEIITCEIQLDFKRSINWDNNNFYFLFAGRLLATKGVEELIYAFLDLHQKYAAVRLIIAGNVESHLDKLHEDIIRKMKNHHAIHSIGWASDIRIAMSVSDVFVHPSHREGFPNVLLQAGAMKLPLICSDCIGNIDIITSGVNGVMFPVKNREKLFEAMEMGYCNPQVLNDYATVFYRQVLNNYTSASVQKDLYNFYQLQLQSN